MCQVRRPRSQALAVVKLKASPEFGLMSGGGARHWDRGAHRMPPASTADSACCCTCCGARAAARGHRSWAEDGVLQRPGAAPLAAWPPAGAAKTLQLYTLTLQRSTLGQAKLQRQGAAPRAAWPPAGQRRHSSFVKIHHSTHYFRASRITAPPGSVSGSLGHLQGISAVESHARYAFRDLDIKSKACNACMVCL